VVSEYPKSEIPIGVLDEDLEVMKEVILEALRSSVMPESGPGVPLARYAATNEMLLKQHLDFVVGCILRRIGLLMKTPFSVLRKYTGPQLVMLGFCDPCRLFVKQEPHSKEKVANKRFRLIMSMSLIDQCVERVFCQWQNNAEIGRWTSCSSKPGIGFSDQWQREAVYKDILRAANGKPFADSDVSAWDWHVTAWLQFMDAEARARLTNVPESHFGKLRNVLLNITQCNLMCVYALSDGRMIEKLKPALQNSGRYNTSSSNSRERVMLAYLVGAAWARAMGDDDVEEWSQYAPTYYSALGYPIKAYNKHNPGEEFEFCSHMFSYKDGAKAYNLNWAKSLYRLLHNKPDSTFLEQFKNEMTDNPIEWKKSLEIMLQVGWGQL